MSWSTGQATWQGAAGHWMQRSASAFAVSGSKRWKTSSKLWTRTSGACFAGVFARSRRRALRSTSRSSIGITAGSGGRKGSLGAGSATIASSLRTARPCAVLA